MIGTFTDSIRVWSRIKIGRSEECWPWLAATTAGYGQVTLAGRRWVVTEVIMSYFDQRRKGGLLIRHTCDNKTCCNPEHLVWGTQSDNMKDRTLRHKGWGKGGRGSRAWLEARHASI